jgi:threonine/homoserine/homoserine lactone efflux protein
MNSTAVAAFATVAVTLIVLPGPDWVYLLTAGTHRRHVLPAVTGLVIGYLVLTVVVAAGIAPVVAATPAATVVLPIVGAAYLLYLGVATLRHAPATTSPHTHVPAAPASTRRFLRRGIGVSGLNPKSVLFFLAFLPQFTRADAAWPLPVQLAFLGALWAAIAAVVYTAMGFTAHHAVRGRPRRQRAISLAAGVAMMLAGTALLGEQLAHAVSASA